MNNFIRMLHSVKVKIVGDKFLALEDSKPVDPNNCRVFEIYGEIPKWAVGTGQDELRRQEALSSLKKSMKNWGCTYDGKFEYHEERILLTGDVLFKWCVALPRNDS